MSEVNDAGERLDVRSVITAQLESTKYEADGWALCCSGGGYKSGAFQVGAFIRLNELGVLRKLKRISSVSGGSIASAYLGLRWNDLEWHHGVATNFDDVFVAPMTRFFTSVSLDVEAVAWGALPHTSGARELERGSHATCSEKRHYRTFRTIPMRHALWCLRPISSLTRCGVSQSDTLPITASG